MKKILWLLMMAALLLTACEKKADDQTADTRSAEDEAFKVAFIYIGIIRGTLM
jgi:protein involved in sex pheromone biosynthesis